MDFLLGGAEGLAAVELFAFRSLAGVEPIESSESSIRVNFLFFRASAASSTSVSAT